MTEMIGGAGGAFTGIVIEQHLALSIQPAISLG
jgi:hypothetical protein